MNEWKKVKLGEVLKEVNERNKGEKVKRVLSVTNSRGFVSQEEYFEGTVHSANISNYKIVRKNQFAYNPSRVNVGSIDILKDYEYGALSPMYIVFEVDTTKLSPDYFKYYFQTNKFFENVKNNTQGSVRNSLSFKALADFDYLLPPIEEQIRIVKLLKKLDLLIDKYEKLIEEKKQFIKKQFVNLLEKERVNIKKLDDLCDVITKQTGFDYTNTIKDTLMQEKSGTCLPYIQTKFFSGRDFNFSTDYYIPIEVAKHYPKILLDNRCILLSIVGASIGNVGLFDGTIKAFLGGAICVAKPKDDINVEYLYYYLISKFGQKQIVRSIKGSGQETVTVEDIRKFDIRLPDENLQSKIVQYIDILDKQKSLLEKQKQNYEKLKKGLMQKLLTGKVRVKI